MYYVVIHVLCCNTCTMLYIVIPLSHKRKNRQVILIDVTPEVTGIHSIHIHGIHVHI